ncbi:MAG TPA: hypothetical protein VN653_04370, partial [Anaerolineales bacterium]|nr:hypothetical protein [Anaerolineales bacterium]
MSLRRHLRRTPVQVNNLLINKGIAHLHLTQVQVSSGCALLAATLILSACLPLTPVPATEPPLPTDTAPPTPTIDWFPASATPTPNLIPTYTSTPEMNPGIGKQIINDNFSDDSVWDTAASEQASAIVKDKHLTLAVEPGVSVASLRRDQTLGNFYAEITARPRLCRADDSYGILIRSTGTSFYRFTLSCNGLIHVERIKSSERLVLSEPIASGDVPLGAPGEVRIGMWAVGGEMRLFLNGRYQFSVVEKTLPSGAFGVFTQSKGDTPVTVTFSDLKVYDVDYTAPTRTPSP